MNLFLFKQINLYHSHLNLLGGARLGSNILSVITIPRSGYPNGKFGFAGPLVVILPNPDVPNTLSLMIERSENLAGQQTVSAYLRMDQCICYSFSFYCFKFHLYFCSAFHIYIFCWNALPVELKELSVGRDFCKTLEHSLVQSCFFLMEHALLSLCKIL